MSAQEDLRLASEQVLRSLYYKHMKQRIEDLRLRVLAEASNAESKDASWELLQQHNGIKRTMELILRIEREQDA